MSLGVRVGETTVGGMEEHNVVIKILKLLGWVVGVALIALGDRSPPILDGYHSRGRCGESDG